MKTALWVIVLFLLGTRAVLAQNDGTIKDIGANVNVRQAPNTLARVLIALPAQTSVSVIGRSPSGLWANIRTGTINGWVLAEYLQANLQDTPILYDAQTITPLDLTPYISEVPDRVKTIYRLGQRLSNRPNVFSKVGDSITESLFTLNAIGEGAYTLEEYWDLGELIDTFSTETARTQNSFANVSLAAKIGWNTTTLFRPDYANPEACNEGESPLACEYRQVNPAFALIMIGTNDVGFVPEGTYYDYLERIVSESIKRGIVPILSTIPPRDDNAQANERVPKFNAIIRSIATRYKVPLMDYHALMTTLPDNGLSEDGIHPSIPPMGYRGVAVFNANNLNYGYTARNLLLLYTLDAVWRASTTP